MSLDEYHARQRAVAAQNQSSQSVAATRELEGKLRDVRRHLEAAMKLIDRDTSPEAWSELEKALATLAHIRP